MAAFLYEFEWDSIKAQSNFGKHVVRRKSGRVRLISARTHPQERKFAITRNKHEARIRFQ